MGGEGGAGEPLTIATPRLYTQDQKEKVCRLLQKHTVIEVAAIMGGSISKKSIASWKLMTTRGIDPCQEGAWAKWQKLGKVRNRGTQTDFVEREVWAEGEREDRRMEAVSTLIP